MVISLAEEMLLLCVCVRAFVCLCKKQDVDSGPSTTFKHQNDLGATLVAEWITRLRAYMYISHTKTSTNLFDGVKRVTSLLFWVTNLHIKCV